MKNIISIITFLLSAGCMSQQVLAAEEENGVPWMISIYNIYLENDAYIFKNAIIDDVTESLLVTYEEPGIMGPIKENTVRVWLNNRENTRLLDVNLENPKLILVHAALKKGPHCPFSGVTLNFTWRINFYKRFWGEPGYPLNEIWGDYCDYLDFDDFKGSAPVGISPFFTSTIKGKP